MHIAAFTDGNSSNRKQSKLAPPKPARSVPESHAKNSCPPVEENLAVASWGGSRTSCHAHGTYVGANDGAPEGPGVGYDVAQTADWQTSEWQSSAVEQENPISQAGQNVPPQSVSVRTAHGEYLLYAMMGRGVGVGAPVSSPFFFPSVHPTAVGIDVGAGMGLCDGLGIGKPLGTGDGTTEGNGFGRSDGV